jgi:prepilin-type N-terminal cleavage/methylation domain-containing protein
MPTKKRAFTLVELLLATALTGVLLTGVAAVTFNMLEAWTAQIEAPAFDRHVDGLRRALEECVAETNESTAVLTEREIGGTIPIPATTVRAATAIFSTPPTSVGVEHAPYLRITGAPGFLLTDSQPVGYVHAWLAVEGGAGLVLYWQTDDERTAGAEDTHRLVLSPWVTDATYKAYSETGGDWVDVDPTNPEAVESGSAIFMTLKLVRDGQTREILLPLADSAPHNLNY